MSLDQYNAVFVKTFEVSESELNESFVFGASQGWDSLAHLELIAALEDDYDIMLEPEEMTSFSSYEKGKEIMRNHGIEIR